MQFKKCSLALRIKSSKSFELFPSSPDPLFLICDVVFIHVKVYYELVSQIDAGDGKKEGVIFFYKIKIL